MIDDMINEKIKKTFGMASNLVSEYLDKHKQDTEYFFLKFDPKLDITPYELTQVMLLNNTIFCMYSTLVSSFANSFFVSSDIYYRLDPDLLAKHFKFLGSEKISINDAYNRIGATID